MPERPSEESPGIAPERTSADEKPSTEVAAASYRELHAETERLSQEETAERDAMLADLQKRIYGGASEQAKIESGKRVEIDPDRLNETQRIIRRAEELRAMGKKDVTFEKAKRSLELEGGALNLDLKDVAEKSGRAAIRKTTEEEIESAIEVPREE